MNETKQTVILGTGPLGLAIMDELAADKQPVKLVNRRGIVDEPLPDGVTVARADCYDPRQITAVCQGADVVFYCTQPPYNQWPELFPKMTAAIIDGVAPTGARLVFGSNVYLYGPTGGEPLHESMPAAGTTRKGRARAEVARMLLEAHAAGSVQTTIGRASDFYGPRVTESAAGQMLFGAAVKGGTANLVGDIDLPHTLTYIRDFARALITLSRRDEAFGRAWHVPNAETLTSKQFVALVGEELGRPVKYRAVGRHMLRLVGLFNPNARESVEMMYEFEEPFIIDHSQFESAFGNGVTPHGQAIRETVAWYMEQDG